MPSSARAAASLSPAEMALRRSDSISDSPGGAPEAFKQVRGWV